MPSGDAAAIERLASEAYKEVRDFKKKHPQHKQAPEPGWVKKLDGVRHVLGDMAHHVETILSETESAIGTAGIGTVFHHLTQLWHSSEEFMGTVTNPHNAIPGQQYEALGEPFVRFFIEDSLGLNLDPQGSHAGNARATIARMAGFVLAFQFAWAGFTALGKAILCERFPETLSESIGKLGEELGLNFAIGEILSTLFETAVGHPIEEAVNMQVHPNRPEMMVLRAIVRQGHLPEGEFKDAINRMGYEEKWANYLLQMDSRQLPIGTLLTMKESGVIKDGEITNILKSQGYVSDDIDLVLALANIKGQSAGANFYREVARREAAAGHISVGQLGSILAEIGETDAEIHLETEAVDMELKVQTSHLSMSVLKKLYLAGEIKETQVHKELSLAGYSDDDIALIIESWAATVKAGSKHLAPGTIVQFYKHGALDAGTAQRRIEDLGYTSSDAADYIKAAQATTTSKVKPLSEGAITSAYRYGVIGRSQAYPLYKKLGIEEADANTIMNTSDKHPVKVKPPTPYKVISEKDIATALSMGLRGSGWAYSEFQAIGYSPDDCALLVDIYAPPNVQEPPTIGQLPGPEEPGGSGSTGSPPSSTGGGTGGVTLPPGPSGRGGHAPIATGGGNVIIPPTREG